MVKPSQGRAQRGTIREGLARLRGRGSGAFALAPRAGPRRKKLS